MKNSVKFFASLIFFLGSFGSVAAGTPDDYGIVNQDTELIESDTTWTRDQIYEITRPLAVVNGATLTIEPGTTIRFVDSEININYESVSLQIIDGTLIARGNSGEKIRFIGETVPFSLDFGRYDLARDASQLEFVDIGDGQDIPPEDDGGGVIGWVQNFFFTPVNASGSGKATVNYWGGKVRIEDTFFANKQNTSLFVSGSFTENWDGDFLSVTHSGFEDLEILPAVKSEVDCESIFTCSTRVIFQDNWYGRAEGPDDVTFMGPTFGLTFLTCWRESCPSNVLFLPGIMGTRLYDTVGGSEEELWVSSSDSRQERMEMNADGTSENDVYTKNDTTRGSELDETGIVDDAYSTNLYESFLEDLRDWKAEGVYNDYAFIPYDWRLSLEDIVMNGRVGSDGNLRYTEDNTELTESYLYQKAKDLQASSRSGKITLIGHSNGGLVIKVFIQKLKDSGDPLYHQIDKIILVGVPQTGTPDTVVSMLYGSKLGMLWLGVSAERSRGLAHHMPSMYNLLPSEKLFDTINPPIELVGNNIDPSWRDRYGEKINTYTEFRDFLLGAEGRNRPEYADIAQAEVLSGSLLGQVESVHSVLDQWVPAPETEVVQIAGWGLYTIAGLRVEDVKVCQFDINQLIGGKPVCDQNTLADAITLRDKLTLNGDATVLVPSAHDIPEGAKVKKYWVDLARYNDEQENYFTERKHRNLLEVDTVRPFVKSVLQNSILNTQDDYIDTVEPNPIEDPYTKYQVHSPLHLTVIDSEGNKAGWDSGGDRVVENIKGAQYFEIGEIKTVLIPKATEHTVKLEAYAQGSFTLDITELVGEEIVEETKFEAIPTLPESVVEIVPATETAPVEMSVDFDADGTVDTELSASPGEEVIYENPSADVEDITPPEISVTFDQQSQDIVWSASDDQDMSPSVVITNIEALATDSAGNTTRVPFVKYRENSTRLKVQFEKIIYNTETTDIPRTTLVYDWRLKKGILVDLDTELRIKEKSRWRAEYRKIPNETKIAERDKEEKTRNIIIKPGFVSLQVKTENKEIIWSY